MIKESEIQQNYGELPYFDSVRFLPNESNQTWRHDVIYIDYNGTAATKMCEHDSELSFILKKSNWNESLKKLNLILLPDYCDFNEIFNNILELFQKFNEWELELHRSILEKHDLQNLLNVTAKMTPNAMYIADLSFKMLAYITREIMEEVSTIWRYQLKYGYLPLNVITRLIESGEIERMCSERKAVVFSSTCFNLPFISRNIYYKNVIQAHLFIVNGCYRPTQTEIEVLEYLGKFMSDHLEPGESYHISSGMFHEQFMVDVLQQRLSQILMIENQLASFGWKNADNYFMFLMDCTIKHEMVRRVAVSYLASEFDCRAFIYEGNIIVVFHVNPNFYNKLKQSLLTLLKRVQCKGSLSKIFYWFVDLHIYYKQIKDSLEIGQQIDPEEYLYLQEDYGIYSISKLCLLNNTIGTICHKGSIDLLQYDERNGTQYFDTLFSYLCCDRNVVKASKSLFIHRNTLMYRLDKIFKIINFDDNNPDIRNYFMMSLYIIKYAEKLV